MLDYGQQALFVQTVNFIQQQKDWGAGTFYQLKHLLIGWAEAVSGVNQQQDEIARLQRGVNFLHHFAVETAIRLVHARRIDEDDLTSRALAFCLNVENALDVHARGLRLFRDDGDLFADERVEQSALTGVGSADDGNET